ncbi:MAG: glycerate kinase [Thermodesulfobacteriota bacterium]|nr:glycerate kinase [Thermodesulfobacteriota bacterium]
MKIVAAPNAFKGSLTATEAAIAMEAGIRRILPDAEVVQVPVADGGDGLVDVAVEALNGEMRSLKVTGPRNSPVEANFCYVKSMDLVTVEMALASGLALLPDDMHDPTLTSTFGTGELIKAGLDLGVSRINVGIGGSATNDGGMGMAQALGVRFLDKDGRELPGIGGSLASIVKIDLSGLDPRIKETTFEAVCDVDNPLYGPKGAAFVYGPQKGATPDQVKELDKGLKNLAGLIHKDLGMDVANMPGAGAAGGLGGGLHAFLGAKLCKGIDLIFDLVGLPEKLAGADLALTGEGQIDFQTVFGKAPGGVGAAARAQGIPCFAIAGSIGKELGDLHESGINAVFSLCPGPMTLEESMKLSKENVTRVTEQAIRGFLAGRNQNEAVSG